VGQRERRILTDLFAYRGAQRATRERLFHVDAYRIDHEEEAYDFGFEEYIESGHAMWIEWAEKVESFLPYKVGVVYITAEEEHTRTIEFFPEVATSQIQWNHE
jgi:tRNA threonylcarbamoyladenosine biosynthesis protein TsaE